MKLQTLSRRNILFNRHGFKYGFLCRSDEEYDTVYRYLTDAYGYNYLVNGWIQKKSKNYWCAYYYRKGDKEYRWIGISDTKMYTFLRLKM